MHSAHHFLWGRPDLALRCEPYFERVRAQARRHTRVAQRYRGVRWPKMAGPPQLMPAIGDAVEPAGAPLFDGPSGAGPLIVWEQVHAHRGAEGLQHTARCGAARAHGHGSTRTRTRTHARTHARTHGNTGEWLEH